MADIFMINMRVQNYLYDLNRYLIQVLHNTVCVLR